MAITYQSIQSNTSTTTSVVVTKPTGLAVGDLMIAIGATRRTTGGTNVVLPTGFTEYQSLNTGSMQIRHSVGFKIADSSDVAASNFTFTCGSTPNLFYGHLIRLSTNLSFPTNPIISGQIASDSAVTTNPTFTINVPSGPAGTFIIGSYFREDSTSGVSNYTTAPVNQTWTERYDNNSVMLSNAIATATNASNTIFTVFELDTVSSDNDNYLTFLVVGEQNNVTSDISHLAVTPTLYGVTASQVNVGVDVGHQTITPSIRGVVTNDSSTGQVWTPIDKS